MTKNKKNSKSQSKPRKSPLVKTSVKRTVKRTTKASPTVTTRPVKRRLNCGRRNIRIKSSHVAIQPNVPFAGYFAAIRGENNTLNVLDRTFMSGGITGFYLEDAEPFETLEEAKEAVRTHSLRLAEDLKIEVTDKASFPVHFFQINGVQRNTVNVSVSIN